jgi:hypothetical protein
MIHSNQSVCHWETSASEPVRLPRQPTVGRHAVKSNSAEGKDRAMAMGADCQTLGRSIAGSFTPWALRPVDHWPAPRRICVWISLEWRTQDSWTLCPSASPSLT